MCFEGGGRWGMEEMPAPYFINRMVSDGLGMNGVDWNDYV